MLTELCGFEASFFIHSAHPECYTLFSSQHRTNLTVKGCHCAHSAHSIFLFSFVFSFSLNFSSRLAVLG